MNDEQLKQRIAYLVEHGGVYDDPLAALHRQVRVLQWLVGTALTLNVTHLVTGVL